MVWAILISVYDAKVRAPVLHRRFRESLQVGMSDEAARGYLAQGYPDLGVISAEGLQRDEFVRRAKQVEGWNRLAVIGPYGLGDDLATQAAGLNPWLQLRVRATGGFDEDGLWKALVIDGGRVVTTLAIEECPFEGVLVRDP